MLPCKQLAAVSCAEGAHVRRRYGPASDAEFLRSIADKTPGRDQADGARQMRRVYLKSYAFVAKEDDDGKKRIMDKTRRAVVDAVSKYRNKPARRSAPTAHGYGSGGSAAAGGGKSDHYRGRGYGCRKAAKHLVSLLLSRLLACTSNKPPPPSQSHAAELAKDSSKDLQKPC